MTLRPLLSSLPGLALAGVMLTPLFSIALVPTGCSSGGSSGSSSGSGSTSGHTGTSSGSGSGSSSGGSGSSGFSGLEKSCNASVPCPGTLTCENVAEIPGGFCSTPCLKNSDCPNGGACAELIPGLGYCLAACTTSSQCNIRAGWTACDPTCGVCIPEAAVGQLSCGSYVVGSGGHLDGGQPCGALPGGAGALTWSASVLASGSGLTYAEAEGALTADTAGHLAIAFMPIPDAGGSDAGSPFNWLGIATSADDGATFTTQAPLISSADAVLYDPSWVRDALGNAYLIYAGLNAAQTQSEIYVSESATNGVSFSGQVNALPGGFDPIDKPFAALNPLSQLPAIVFADLQNGFGGASRISIVSGTGPGQYSSPVDLDDGTRGAARDLATLAFDSAGYGYAAWVEIDASGSAVVYEDQATGTKIAGTLSGGIYATTFPPSAVGAVQHTSNQLVSAMAEAIVLDSARVAVAPDSSWVYVAYVVAAADNATDIRLAASRDQGRTWSRVTVNADPGCATHFHASPYIDSSGNLWVSWVDNRDGNGHVFYAKSTDHGATFSPAALVSDQPFYFTTLIDSAQTPVPAWLGGYQFLGGTGTELYSLWSGATSLGQGLLSPAHVYLQKATVH